MRLPQEKEMPENLNEKLKTSSLIQSEAFIPIFDLSESLNIMLTERQYLFFIPH